MAINFPHIDLGPGTQRRAQSNVFRVKDRDAFQVTLRAYPNLLTSIDPSDSKLVVLHSLDGTWYTGFANGEETCVLDEVLLDHMEEGQFVHLYLFAFSPTRAEFYHYALAWNGTWESGSLREIEQHMNDHLMQPHR